MKSKFEKRGVLRAAMRAVRAAFCVLRRPAAVVCVHIPAALLAVQLAAAWDFVRPAAEVARLAVAAPAWAQANICGIRETYYPVAMACDCLPGHASHTESGLTICQSRQVINRAAECVAQGWRSTMNAAGRMFCGIQLVDAAGARLEKCEWSTGLIATAHICSSVFGRLPSELTDADRRLYPNLEAQKWWRLVDGKHTLLPRNENLGEQRYRTSCPGEKIRDPNFRPPGVQRCVCNPDTHSAGENGECVLLPVVLAETDECAGRGWEAVRAGGRDYCRIASVKPGQSATLASCVLSGAATASVPACGDVFGDPPRLPEKTDNGPGTPDNPVLYCDTGEFIHETVTEIDFGPGGVRYISSFACQSDCSLNISHSKSFSRTPHCVTNEELSPSVNECAARNGPCHDQAICRDPSPGTRGDVQCVCPANFTGDGLADGVGCVSAPEARECVKQGWEIFRQGESRRCRIAVQNPPGTTMTSCVLSGTAIAGAPACRDVFGSPPAIPEKTAGGEGTPERPLLYCAAGEKLNRVGAVSGGKESAECVSSCASGRVSVGTVRPRCLQADPLLVDECAANSGKGPCDDRASCRDLDAEVPSNAQCVCPLGLKGDGRAGGSGCAEDCPAQFRVTNEDTGACGGCLPGYAEEQARGICRPAPDCAAAHREQGSDPFVCGACQAGYVYVNDVCRKTPDCALRNRVLDGAVCGACLAGHAQDSFNPGFCKENLDCAAVHRAQSGPFVCGACLSGFTDSEGTCRPHADCASLNRVQATPLTCGDCAAGHSEIDSTCVPAQGLGSCGAQFRVESASGGGCGACLSGFMERGPGRSGTGFRRTCFPGPCASPYVENSPAGACFAEPPASADDAPAACVSRNFNYARFWRSNEDWMEGDISKSVYECTTCVSGFHRVDGACLPVRQCADENRAAESAAVCGACLPGFTEIGEICRPLLDCAAVLRRQVDAVTCGACEAGKYETSDGVCAPTIKFFNNQANGILVARVQEGAALLPGDAVTVGTPVEFTATPDAGFYVSLWIGASCAGEAHGSSDDAGAKTCRVPFAATVTTDVVFADINECEAGPLSPNADSCMVGSVCENTAGSYECACAAGRVPAGLSTNPQCVDVNECELGTHACGSKSNCVNTLGGHTCGCQNAGWSMTVSADGAAWCGVPVLDKSSGETRTLCAIAGTFGDAPDCAEVFGASLDFPSAADHAENTFYAYNCPGGKMPDASGLNCVCPPGQEDIGGVCDVDECAQTTSICGGNASCFNLESSYACVCKPGSVPGPGATPQAPQCAPAAEEPAANPAAPVITRPVAADFANERFTVFWGPPANASGGEILQYRFIRAQTGRIDPADPVYCDSDQATYTRKPELAVFTDANIFTRALNVGRTGASGASHGICYRWHIAARTAAGWGPESVTDPILSRPLSTEFGNCPEGRFASLLGSCVRGVRLEGADSCARLKKTVAPAVASGWFDRDQTYGGDEYDFSCLVGISNYDCGSLGSPARFDSSQTLCPLNRDEIHCGALSEYRSDHRECMCKGYATESGVTLSAIHNIRGKIDCACDVSGADANCECPAGMKYRPDLNACRNECATAGWALTVSADGGSLCDIPVRDGEDEVSYPACAMSGAGAGAPACDEVFGANSDFPLKADHAPGTFYAYNCPGGQAPNAAGTACACPALYEENAAGVCVNIDECAAGADDCPSNAACVNTDAGHTCTCPFGHTFSGGECLCDGGLSSGLCLTVFAEGSANCSDSGWDRTLGGNDSFCHIPIRDASATINADREKCRILNTPEGRAAGHVPCEDVFPDLMFPLSINHNAGERYVYNCPRSRERSADLKSCGVCSDGHREKADGTCEDIDECATEATNTCGSAANNQCVNTAGSYECACVAGYAGVQLDDRLQCADIDECELGAEVHGCGIDAACANTLGGHTCACQAAGWNLTVFANGNASCEVPVKNGGSDEIWPLCNLTGAAQGAPDCAEVFGESLDFPPQAGHNAGEFYIYGCPAPQTTGFDRKSCVCPSGGELKGGQCADIDECQTGTVVCQEHASCVNADPGHACACDSGYVRSDLGDMARCVEVDECAMGTDVCGDDAVCINTAGSYECVCSTHECAGRESVVIAPPVNGTIVGRHGDSLTLTGLDNYLPLGTTLTFSAIPDADHTVSAWTDDCAGASVDGACVLVIGGGVAVGALFARIDPCDAVAGRYAYVNGERQCVCPVRETILESGVCGACPPGEGILAGGGCGACPDGRGIVSGGHCGACPDGYLSINNVCEPEASKHTLPGMALTLYNMLDAALESYQTPLFSDGAPNVGLGALFTVAIREYQQGILDRHNGKADYLGNLEGFQYNMRGGEPNLNRRNSGGAYGRFLTSAERAGFDLTYVVDEFGNISDARDGGETERVLSQIPIRVAGAQQCLNAGWGYSTSGESCGIPLTLSGGRAADQCHLSGGAWPQCADAFGAGLEFPRPTLSAAGATLRFIYNCDPTGKAGFVPAGANTIGGTECVCAAPGGCECPDGEELVGGVCLPSAVADQCEAAGWTLLADEGACEIPLILWGGGGSDRCYFSGSARPQCEEVFGSPANYFPRPVLADSGATLRFIYNCDPAGETGFIPAAANTFAATECACPAGEGPLPDGVCGVCPDGGGILASGLCGACPSGEIPVNNVCKPAATTHTLPGKALTLYNSLEAALESYQPPIFADGTPNFGPGALFTIAIREYQQGILDRHNGKRDYLGNLESYEADAPNRRSAGGAFGRFFRLAEDAGFLPVDERKAELVLSQIPIRVAGAQECLNAGWDYSPAGESCGVPLTLSGGEAADECHLSGGGGPQCADAFGAGLAFPRPTLSAAGATLRFVYNCDPDGSKRQVPATVNTFGATECGCAIVGQDLVDGVCACSADQGLLADGVCGVCPVGQGVLAGGVCGFCPGGQVARDQMCACPFTGQSLAEGACACPAEQGVYAGACGACPDEWILENGTCVPGPAVIAAANATLLAEVRKPSPNLAVMREALSLNANPNVTTSAGIPVLVVAATMLRAKAVSVLITAGADPLVKVDGVYDATYNRNTVSRFIPEALMERGLRSAPTDGGRRLAETFIHFGDAAGVGFDWRAASPGGETTGNAAFALTDALRRLIDLGGGVPPLEAVLRYLLDRGATCRSVNFYDLAAAIPSSLCARPVCPATSDPIYSCSACGGFPLRGLGGGFCVAQCEREQFTDTTIWPDGRCVAIDPAIVAAANATLAAEIQTDSPSLAAVRTALDAGANPNHLVGGSPALLAAASRLHAEVVSVLVTAGANVNAAESASGAFRGWDVAHYAASRPGGLPAADSRALRAKMLRYFGDALDARNAMFADADFDWSRDSSVVGGGFTTSMLDRLAGAEEILRRNVLFGDPAGDDADVINQMADYAFFRGARCVGTAVTPSTHANTRRVCRSTAEVRVLAAQAALAAEVEKPAGAAKVSVAAALLSGADAADPNGADSAGRPLLIAAARNGHAEIVSVLITAGADVNATDPTYSDYDAALHAAAPLADPAAGPRALRASVLYYFGGGVDARNAASGAADYDWNREDANGRRLLDLLALAEDAKPRPAGEDADIIRQMADYALVRGAHCGGATADKTRRVCTGAPRIAGARVSLVEEVKKAAGAADAAVVADLLDEEGGHPNIEDSAGQPLLMLAARNGHAEIVSVLITAGADVNAADAAFRGFGVAHHAASPLSGANAGGAAGPRALRASVLYYFGGGLDVRNAASGDAAFDWNREDARGFRPLDLLADASGRIAEVADRPLLQDMADYLIARGAECGGKTADHGQPVCRGRLKALYAFEPSSGGSVTVFGTDGFADGEAFVYSGRTVTFTATPVNGWQLSTWEGNELNCPPFDRECAVVAADRDLWVTARFSPAPRARHAAEFDPPGQIRGSVTVFGTDGFADGEAFVYSGRTVTFTATPVNGWQLSAWEGNELNCPPFDRECAVVAADRDLWVTARFSPAPRVRHASEPSSGGSVTIAGTDGEENGEAFVYSGRTVTFTAEPANGWEVSVWAGDAAACLPSNWKCEVVAANDDLWVTALFSEAPRARFSFDPSDKSRGRVTVTGTDGVEDGVDFVYSGGTVTFTAEPARGYRLSAWLGDCAGKSQLSCEVAATLDVSVGATFDDINECQDPDHMHNCAAAEDGGFCANTDGGFTCSCVAGYSGSGEVCYADKTVSFRQPANGTLSAAGAGVSIDTGETTRHGTTVTFTADPARGYRLSAWLGDCAGESQLSCEVAATLDVSAGATFDDINECQDPDHMHNCAAEEDGGFCANTDGGFTCSCVAGYSGSGEVCYADKTVSFRQPANGTLSAAGAGVTIDTGETTRHGTTVTFTAEPADGYRLSAWLGDCAGKSQLSCEVAVTLDVSVGATFDDINECQDPDNMHNCAAAEDGGFCANTDGSFICSCAAGYSGDGMACYPDKTVSFQPPVNGVLFAASGVFSIRNGGAAAHGTTITFTASPAAGYRIAAWLGACADTAATVMFCEAAATVHVDAGVRFTDIDECETNKHNCAADGGLCANTEGGFTCDCAAGYIGDGRICHADKTVSFRQPANGTLSAESAGVLIPDGGTAAHGTTVTFTAAPDAGWQASMWTGACAGTSVDASAGRAFCEVEAVAAVSVGATFTYIGRCAVSGHLIFGASPNRRCAPPTICPANYAADNDCLPAAPAETGSPAPDLPAAANEPNACERVFGGRLRTAGGGQTVCSNVDRNDTFCIVGSQTAFPCQGLFRHVWKCNTYNRPALNPFFCGEHCEGRANTARGRECGQETL